MSQTRLDLPPSPAQILEAREQPFLPKAGYSTPCRCLWPRGLRDDHMAANTFEQPLLPTERGC